MVGKRAHAYSRARPLWHSEGSSKFKPKGPRLGDSTLKCQPGFGEINQSRRNLEMTECQLGHEAPEDEEAFDLMKLSGYLFVH
ncbi:hypothetical protein CDAR_379341 [Caerostris darwini]|uniref:Uncharacterized protein n=1 Tax=Caerostris darwini TaxID=1538125 RepID=A0AAV4VBC1_9ARAC|nr:hypothetical protein CDAR_379341 [Caerostris darwini]